MSGNSLTMQNSVLTIFLAVNAVAIFCAVNPWFQGWQNAGIVLLVVEAVFLLLIGLPSVFYQMIWKKKTLKQSLNDSVKYVLDLVSYFT